MSSSSTIKITLSYFTKPPGNKEFYVELHELWKKVGYTIPYNRWLRYSMENHNIRIRPKLQKLNGPGRPYKMAFVSLEMAAPLLNAICRRRHVQITVGDILFNGKDGDKESESGSDVKFLRRPGGTHGGLRLVRD